MAFSPYGYQTYLPQLPVTQYQQRQDYMQQPAQQMPAQTNATGFSCRPVTSREEAVAVLSDYFTQGTLMPDLGHGRVYLKRFNPNTGASDFFEFTLMQPEPEVQTDTETDKLMGYLSRIEASCAKVEALICKLNQYNDVKECESE